MKIIKLIGWIGLIGLMGFMGLIGHRGRMGFMGFIKWLGLMIIMIIMIGGCSRLRIERDYNDSGIVREEVVSYGFFINRANQLRLNRTSDPLSGEKDLVESAIDEDASPGNEALRDFIEVYKLGVAASAAPGVGK